MILRSEARDRSHGTPNLRVTDHVYSSAVCGQVVHMFTPGQMPTTGLLLTIETTTVFAMLLPVNSFANESQ